MRKKPGDIFSVLGNLTCWALCILAALVFFFGTTAALPSTHNKSSSIEWGLLLVTIVVSVIFWTFGKTIQSITSKT